MNSNCF